MMPEMLLSTKGQKLVFARQPPQHIITDDLTLVIRILHAHLMSVSRKNSTRNFLGYVLRRKCGQHQGT